MKEFQKIGHIIYGLSLPVTVNYVFLGLYVLKYRIIFVKVLILVLFFNPKKSRRYHFDRGSTFIFYFP